MMLRCPTCNRIYTDESLSFCLDDGSRLIREPGPPIDSRTLPYSGPTPSPPHATPLQSTLKVDAPQQAAPPSWPSQTLERPVKKRRKALWIVSLGLISVAFLVICAVSALLWLYGRHTPPASGAVPNINSNANSSTNNAAGGSTGTSTQNATSSNSVTNTSSSPSPDSSEDSATRSDLTKNAEPTKNPEAAKNSDSKANTSP